MSTTETIQSRLAAVRTRLRAEGVQAYIQPRADEYLGEYVPEHNERLWWLTGFTGSAGHAVVLEQGAGIFVDGRYTIQVRQQVPADCFSYLSLTDDDLVEWLVDQLPRGAALGYDPRLHTASWARRTQAALSRRGLKLMPMAANPVDASWADRPAPACKPVRLFPHATAGATSVEKRRRIGALIEKEGADVALIPALDSIAWLLNLRGDDIPCLPVILASALLYANGDLIVFTDLGKITDAVPEHVGEGVSFRPEAEMPAAIAQLRDLAVLADPDQCNAWSLQLAESAGARLVQGRDPVALPKAAKNAAELAGMRAAHIRDGAAVTRFLAWLDAEVAAGRLHNEAVLADQLLAFRKQLPEFLDSSFDTISAAGGNAAMAHYNHLNGTPAVLPMNSIYLVDSGAQYPDGTTDVTRTVAIGQVSDEVKKMVTLVLKGHIALDRARFPKGTTGQQLDALARQYLWAEGYDYDHGTGHGVGHSLNVHEGPQRIAKNNNGVALLPGMVCSNEPGYYRDNAFGIRLENLVAVRPCEALQGAERETYEFEALTLVPLDTRLFLLELLTEAERQWLNGYHARVRAALAPLLASEPATLAWLERATAAV